MAADHAGMLGEGTLHALFELADAQHLSVEPDLTFCVGCLHAHLIPLTLSGDRYRDSAFFAQSTRPRLLFTSNDQCEILRRITPLRIGAAVSAERVARHLTLKSKSLRV